jgi:cation diffusion facilitator CzcD-associated flavoprotein CzcO
VEDAHVFPGIRSDSDLFTFGFSWKPWTGFEIATAQEILKYLHEAVDDLALRPHIRFGSDLAAADWDASANLWRLTVRRDGRTETLTTRFLWMCQGYYRHETPHMPSWPGTEDFKGRLVHAQTWPDDLDCAGKQVVVIGSGATAATVVPALAKTAAQVTMLQRSPTYFFPSPKEHELATLLRPLNLPDDWFHEIMRRKYLHDQKETQRRAKEEPEALEADLIGMAEALLGGAAPVDPHFTPRYRIWKQRLARIPEGDLYAAVRDGRAAIATDRIERFDEGGIVLTSGARLDADVVVAATGFDLCVMGDAAFSVDGAPIDWSKTVTYRGIMFSGVPNLAWVFGYLRTSWTMRADLVSLGSPAAGGDGAPRRRLRHAGAGGGGGRHALRPYIDPENFNAGYVMRGLDIVPRQGDRARG